MSRWYQFLQDFFSNNPVAWAIQDGLWWFPALESAHVVSAALMVGALAYLDLRLLWAASRERSVSKLSAEVLTLVWIAFAVAFLSGALMFISNAARYGTNPQFIAKMILLVLAGLNMAAFHFLTAKRAHEWDSGRPPILAARLAGLASLAFWIWIVILGRWIGFS